MSGAANCTEQLNMLASYDYRLPEGLIAQNPAEPRDSSRLLVVNKKSGELLHRNFYDLPLFLKSGDLLVLNDTRVFPARLKGVKKGGSAKIEMLFLSGMENTDEWSALVKPGKRLNPGSVVILSDGTEVTVGEGLDDGLRRVVFPEGSAAVDIFSRLGQIPLPPYITESAAEDERYQTVYSDRRKDLSSAAPTAGLHFTEALLDSLKSSGVDTAFITLHVGLGTFKPVKAEDVRDHVMHEEFCEIPRAAAEKINRTRREGGRVIAVGTTVARTLESFAVSGGELAPGVKKTRLFIKPGFEFRTVDFLVTNFHLPKSTLLMLVSAFGGYELMMRAYGEAVEEGYRFFSFGDSMLIADF